jgi:hypothetical protein
MIPSGENMLEIICNLRYLPETDKDLLMKCAAVSYGQAQACLPTLSIFKQDIKRFAFDHYDMTAADDQPIYYVGHHHKLHLAVFFDQNKKLLFNSRYYLTHLRSFLQFIDSCLCHLQNIDLASATDIGQNLLAIERWFITYGHYKDEAYTLGDVLSRLPGAFRCRALLDYPTDDRLNTTGFAFNINYQKIDQLVFGDRSLNAYKYGSVPLKMSGIQLISNGFDSKGFHAFPPAVARRIKAQVKNPDLPPGPVRMFLTRSSSYRDITNKAEVESYFVQRGFTLVNPEQIAYEELVRQASDTESVAIYYGSALTNMVYFKPGTRIYILKSASYMQENLSLWRKVIDGYQLEVVEIPAIDNVIPEAALYNLDLAG